MKDVIDCRSEVGVTVGLIDGIIACARVLARRDLTDPAIVEALKDIRFDEDIRAIVNPWVAQNEEPNYQHMAASWHRTVECMCVLIGINGWGSPEEILAELQAKIST